MAKSKVRINTENQFYKGIQLNCIPRRDYYAMRAKRFIMNDTNQNVWIPNKHLAEDGTILEGEDIDYVFRKARRQCELAGVNMQMFLRVHDMYSRNRSPIQRYYNGEAFNSQA